LTDLVSDPLPQFIDDDITKNAVAAWGVLR
jgi:hypothetical protein